MTDNKHPQLDELLAELHADNIKMGDIKKRAALIKKDHSLAQSLWASGSYYPRLLAVLIFDKKQLTSADIDRIANDINEHDEAEANQLADWLLANQLMKDKTLTALISTWQQHSAPVLQRLFWYHQARLRWTGKTPPNNSVDLLQYLEKHMENAEPKIQWAMNFCAGQIGINEPEFRQQCIDLGQRLGLYKDEVVPKNCTPSYLPEFIRIEVAKR